MVRSTRARRSWTFRLLAPTGLALLLLAVSLMSVFCPLRTGGRLWATILPLFLPSPACASSLIEKDLALEPGGRFVLETDEGSVVLTGTEESGVHLRIRARRDDLEEKMEFKFEERAGEVVVRAMRKQRFSWRGTGVGFEITVPRRCEVSVQTSGGSIEVRHLEGEVELDTSGGSIAAREIQGGLTVRTSGGSLELSQIDGNVEGETAGGSVSVSDVRGSLRAQTSGGSIEVDDVAKDLEVETSGGSIQIRGAGGRVDAHTSGGSIEVGFLEGNAAGGDISTSSGQVSIGIDPDVSITVDAKASSGRVETDLPIGSKREGRRRSELSGDLGSGGELLRVRCSAGSVEIFAI